MSDAKAFQKISVYQQRQHHDVQPPEQILPLLACDVLEEGIISIAFYVDVKRVSKGICFEESGSAFSIVVLSFSPANFSFFFSSTACLII
jgi:hypothetical protein